MKDFIKRLLRGDETPPPEAPAARDDLEQANQEMVIARHELRKSRGERKDAEEVAKRLHRENVENHFAYMLRMALKGVIE